MATTTKRRLLDLPAAGRGMGIRVVASRGTGKSRLLGRALAWQDFRGGIPTVVIDPVGGVVDNFLDKLHRLPRAEQRALWPRVRYVDMGGAEGRVVPMPLYYRTGQETLYRQAQRFLDVVRRSDPALQGASVLGFNALAHIGVYVGIVLAATGQQITEAEDLLSHPQAWGERIRAAEAHYAELAPAAQYFLHEYPALPPRERDQQTMSFRRKVAMFRLDPVLRAQYGANVPGIDWREVVERRLCVLFDYRNVLDHERKRFGILWALQHLMEYIKERGPGRHWPLALLIDELTFLLGHKQAKDDPVADDLEELIARLARNHRVWVTLCHQELNQVSERVGNILMTMGSQVFGSSAEVEAAETVAGRFFRFDPLKVKKQEPIYDRGVVIDWRSQEYTRAEQTFLNAEQVLDLPRFTFLVAACQEEGTLPTALQRVSIAGLDRDQYVDEAAVSRIRRALMRRDGRSVEDVHAEIAARQDLPAAETLAEAPRRPVGGRRRVAL